MNFLLRKAELDDRKAIEALITASVRGLAKGIYDERQIELSITSVFGLDIDLINDRTYFVVEHDERIVGCGGWSKRKTLYGASRYAHSRDPEYLHPRTDAAKIRAFFIHPDFARKGLGTLILKACESEAANAGFLRAEMMATLPGVPFYETQGYDRGEATDVPIGDSQTIVCIRMSKDLDPE